MEINYDERCENCNFKYCEAYEEQVYSCMFDFNCCKLTEFEKKKIQRLENQTLAIDRNAIEKLGQLEDIALLLSQHF